MTVRFVGTNRALEASPSARRLAAFEDRYNRLAVPFDWRFGRDDLDKFLVRLEARQAA